MSEAMTDEKLIERLRTEAVTSGYVRLEAADRLESANKRIAEMEARLLEHVTLSQEVIKDAKFGLENEKKLAAERDALRARWEKLKEWLPYPENDVHPDSFVAIAKKMQHLEESK